MKVDKRTLDAVHGWLTEHFTQCFGAPRKDWGEKEETEFYENYGLIVEMMDDLKLEIKDRP